MACHRQPPPASTGGFFTMRKLTRLKQEKGGQKHIKCRQNTDCKKTQLAPISIPPRPPSPHGPNQRGVRGWVGGRGGGGAPDRQKRRQIKLRTHETNVRGDGEGGESGGRWGDIDVDSPPQAARPCHTRHPCTTTPTNPTDHTPDPTINPSMTRSLVVVVPALAHAGHLDGLLLLLDGLPVRVQLRRERDAAGLSRFGGV